MKYHIDTIPVWDAAKKECECLLCSIEEIQEEKAIDFYLGDSVMQPDIRQETNKVGFCINHYNMMYSKSKKLPMGLSAHSRLEYINDNLGKYFDRIEKEEKALKKSGAIECCDYIEKITSDCSVCSTIEENMKRYFFTFIHLWKNEDEFRAMFLKSKGLCLKHFQELIRFAQKEAPDKVALDLAKGLARVQNENLQRLAEEVKYFNDKFDHRNVDKPWGTAKDALPRAINKLTGGKIRT
ncbi:MAG: DUF6062 family protein [Eubacteriales bacterium]